MHIQVCCTHLNYCIVRPNSCTSRTYPIQCLVTSTSYMTHGYFFIVLFTPGFFCFFTNAFHVSQSFSYFSKKKLGFSSIFVSNFLDLVGCLRDFPPKPSAPRGLRLRWSAGDPATSGQRQLRGQRPPTGPGPTGGTQRAGAWVAMEFRDVPKGVPMVFPWFSPKS